MLYRATQDLNCRSAFTILSVNMLNCTGDRNVNRIFSVKKKVTYLRNICKPKEMFHM